MNDNDCMSFSDVRGSDSNGDMAVYSQSGFTPCYIQCVLNKHYAKSKIDITL